MVFLWFMINNVKLINCEIVKLMNCETDELKNCFPAARDSLPADPSENTAGPAPVPPSLRFVGQARLDKHPFGRAYGSSSKVIHFTLFVAA